MMLIQPYQRKWKDDFEAIRSILIEGNGNIDIKVEHIGSTSVPKLSAKPIIDIDLIYFSENDFFEIQQNLQLLGYYHNGNQGIEGREVFKRFREDHFTLDSIDHHLYVCLDGTEELQRHLLFRDHLKQNQDARTKYAAIKIELAQEANQDKKKYAALKEKKANAFINTCIENQRTNGK